MLRLKKSSDNGLVPAVDFSLYPAKTFARPDGTTVAGRTVKDHTEIVGLVAKALISRYPEAIRDRLFPEGSHLVASAHDVGKISPFFVEKIRLNCDSGIEGIPVSAVDPKIESDWGGHSGVSQLTASALNLPKYVPEILGQHHGFAPPVSSYSIRDQCFGSTGWQQAREQLLAYLKDALESEWPHIQSHAQSRAVGGLTTVADWIGSGRHFEDPSEAFQGKIEVALDDAGMTMPTLRHGLSFNEIFGFDPRDAQRVLVDAVTRPGVYVLEGQMGMGKTEAALYCAYKMLDQGQARGIYFAMPTQLTSNKIYDRFNQFLSSVLDEDCKHRSLLLHGSAHLLEKADFGEDAAPGGDWFNSAKRGLLAPFAVGTLDQALMGVMNVRHGAVRAFGLAGKVVILDEVHTYDAYTGTILDSLVAMLRELHCTVIILSATLNKDKREDLVGTSLCSADYPLITASPNGDSISELAVSVETTHTVAVDITNDDDMAVSEALEKAIAGQQVLWIENTVNEAQQRYQQLSALACSYGVETGLIHSRFTQQNRSKHEDHWVNLFGKPGWDKRAERGRILIGTQVLEQSIDIDADFLVTRFCPTDMLLQRIGRLWRHSEAPRNPSATCTAMILAPDLKAAIEDPAKAFAATAFVYSPYVLCRALEVWQSISTVSLPDDIRPLVESSYAKREETAEMSKLLYELENGNRRQIGRKALQQMASLTLAASGQTFGEDKAQTRYSENKTADVLLARKITGKSDTAPARVELLCGEVLDLPRHKCELTKNQNRILSALLTRHVVKVQDHQAPEQVSQKVLRELGLHHCLFLGHPDNEMADIRIGIVDEAGFLRGMGGSVANSRFEQRYEEDLGYMVKKRESNE